MRPIPSREDLLALMHALLANASELVDDAELLLENERFPRAYALAALGGEELGKIYLCLDALLPIGEMDDKQFWWGWRHHGDKIGSLQAYALAFIDDLEQLNPEDLRREADRLASQKLAAIYVDFVDGNVATPNTVAPLDASTLTGRVREAVEHARQQLSQISVEVIAAMDVLGPAIRGLMKESLASGDQKQILAGFRQLLVDVPAMSPEDLVILLTRAVEESDLSGG